MGRISNEILIIFTGTFELLTYTKTDKNLILFIQVFLHLNILFDSIMWSRSAAKMNCVTCRSSKSPEYTLLCDECNKGYHTFCLKPKVKVIPEGNWYCPKCKPEDFVIKRGRKRRAFTEEEPEEIQEEEEGDTQEEEDTSMMNGMCLIRIIFK